MDVLGLEMLELIELEGVVEGSEKKRCKQQVVLLDAEGGGEKLEMARNEIALHVLHEFGGFHRICRNDREGKLSKGL